MTTPHVDLSIEPPDLEPEPDERPMIQVWVTMWEADGTRRAASVVLNADANDDAIAEALCEALLGLGVMRGPGLLNQVKARLMIP